MCLVTPSHAGWIPDRSYTWPLATEHEARSQTPHSLGVSGFKLLIQPILKMKPLHEIQLQVWFQICPCCGSGVPVWATRSQLNISEFGSSPSKAWGIWIGGFGLGSSLTARFALLKLQHSVTNQSPLSPLSSPRSFGGFASPEKYAEEAQALARILKSAGQSFHEDFYYTAGYDSPFKLFNRHNEVWYFKK